MVTRTPRPLRQTAKKKAAVPAPPVQIAPLADVFISYSHHDQAIARTLTATLRAEGFDVWFDEQIYAGAEWERLLIDVINHAKAVLVLWSANAIASQWVRKEALIALETRRLVPVAIEALVQPPPFDAWQAAMMPGWQGGDHPELERLLAGLSKLAPPSRLETVRPGFDTCFLPTEIELPAITGVAEEFRYLHFSVALNPARRLAWYVACNMARYDGPAVQRGDRWLADPMLPASFQPGNAHFLGTGLDRGHIARVRAVSWGSEREAALANRQAFFWTNTTPQHPLVNRHAWLALEQWEEQLVQARGRAIGFSGPRLADDDPVHGQAQQTIGRLRVKQNFHLPKSFWKVVLAQAEGGPLQAAAFWIDQDAVLREKREGAALVLKGKVAETAARYRCSVVDVEARTGIDFGDAVRGAAELPGDPLAD